MLRPRIFFDTPVCIDVAKGNIPHRDWQRIWKRVTESFRYCISPLTLYEMLVGLRRGDDRHFQHNLESLRVLHGTRARRTFLKFPGRFLIETVLGMPMPRKDFEPSDFKKQLEVTLKAPDKRSLEEGRVELRSFSSRTFGMNLKMLEEHSLSGKEVHAETLEKFRKGKFPIPSPKQWAAGIVKAMLAMPITEEKCVMVASALDAAYRFDKYLWLLAQESNYNFSKHASDWVDLHQLYYLCAEDMHVLTADEDLTMRTEGSHQRKRIWRLSDISRHLA